MLVETQVFAERQTSHVVTEHPARLVCISIQNLNKRWPREGNLQIWPQINDFFHFFAPGGVFVYLVKEQVLSTHDMESISCLKKSVIGEIHAIHHTVKCLTGIHSIILSDVLSHKRCLADSMWSTDRNKLFLPVDRPHYLRTISVLVCEINIQCFLKSDSIPYCYKYRCIYTKV